MSNVDVDVSKVIESLSSQIAQQAQRIALLEATLSSVQASLAAEREKSTAKK